MTKNVSTARLLYQTSTQCSKQQLVFFKDITIPFLLFLRSFQMYLSKMPYIECTLKTQSVKCYNGYSEMSKCGPSAICRPTTEKCGPQNLYRKKIKTKDFHTCLSY